ncbi:MAG: response regulator [Terriglobia bacterium]
MRKVRILLADDHEVVRHGLRRLLEAEPGWEICGEAATGREAVEKTRQEKPDVVVLDFSMPGLNGAEAARQILKGLPRTEILVLTMHSSEEMVHEILAAGARGCVSKSDASRDLVSGIRAVVEHKSFLSPGVSGVVVERYLQETEGETPRDRLTPREREIIQLLAEGKSNKEVASLLNISIKTVEAHRANLMHKLKLSSLSDLVHYAIRNRIVEA